MKVPGIVDKTIEYGLRKPLDYVANCKLMKPLNKVYQDKDLQKIAAVGIISIILKDGLGCYKYVSQSLNNKDIPDDKRKFVAALDLANGGLMILAQLLAFRTVSNEKVQAKLLKTFFGKHFSNITKAVYEKTLKNKDALKTITNREFNLSFDKFHKKIVDTFGLFATLVASTILAKRVIVPFVSTPLAEKTAKILGKNKEPQVENNADKDTFTAQAK